MPIKKPISKPVSGAALKLRSQISKGKIISQKQHLTSEQTKNARAQYDKLMRAEIEKNKIRKQVVKKKAPVATVDYKGHLTELISAVNNLGKLKLSAQNLQEARKAFSKLNSTTRTAVIKTFLESTGNKIYRLQTEPRFAAELNLAFRALDVRASDIVSTNIQSPIQRLLVLGYTRAEIESVRNLNKNVIAKELNSTIDYFANKKEIDFRNPTAELNATNPFARQILIRGIRAGYRDVIVNRITELYKAGRLTDNRAKTLLNQIQQISAVGRIIK